MKSYKMDDMISRQATIDAMETVYWYHINKNGQLASGANSKEYEPLYKAEDVYKILNDMPSVQPEECTETPVCDCISRQAAIHIASGYCHPANIAAELSKLPSAQPEQRWIPVSERLPEEHVCDDGFVEPSVSVLVQLNNKEMKVSRYWGSRESYKDEPWIDLSYPTTLEVVAWMPLPEPYRESEDKG